MMVPRHLLQVFGSLGILASWYSAALSTMITETVSSKDVVAYSNVQAELGTFYTLNFVIPEGVAGKALNGVVLEFYVDAALTEGVQAARTPVIEILPLTRTFSGGTERPQFATTATSVRGLTLGEKRKVLVDITAIVKGWIENPSAKHGLVIGSLTDAKNGKFTLRRDVFGADTVAKVTFWCRD